jgi:hypothetical protein
MAKPWYKMWTNILEKEEFFALNGDQTRRWIMFMAVAQRADDEGRLPPMKSIRFALREDEETCQKWIDEMVELHLIDIVRSRYVIHNWKRWQGDGKSDAQRKREQRERERDMSRDNDVTSHETVTNESQSCHNLAGAKTKTTDKEKDNTPPTPRKRVVRLEDFSLPDWIPETDWNDWLLMRKAKKAPATPGAMAQAVRELEKLRADGHDPGAVLRQSTFRAWVGVFPISIPYANGTGKPNETPALKAGVKLTPEERERINARAAKALDY